MFGDIPLFQELQRLLGSSEGPINLEIARQVGGTVISQAGPEASPTPEVERVFAEAVRSAEVMLAGYTRLPLDEPMRSTLITRRAWMESTLTGWKWLLDRLATRFTAELGRMGGQLPGAETAGEEGGGPLEAAMAQVGPLLLGMQAGQLMGMLATESLTRYDFPVPRDDDGHLLFVHGNIEVIARDFGFAHDDFRCWLAVRESARHLVLTAVPWLGRYYRGLLTALVDAIEIDVSDLERRMMELQTRGMDALRDEGGQALPVVHTERHERALGRVRSLVALLEGYASHASTQVLPTLVPDAARIDEGVARIDASPSDAEEMLAGLLGISFDRALATSGATFCAAVVQIKGLGELNRVWEAPDNLPTPEEIRDPFAWMERVLGD